MEIENLQLGDKIDYADYPELFGDELTFEQLCTEPSSSLLVAWRSAFAGSNAEDAKQAEICRVERVTDYEDGDLYIATVMLDAGGKSPFPVEWDDMEETEPDDEADKMHIWNLYDRIWRLKQEEPEMIVTEQRTPPADANLAVTEQYTTAYNLNVKIHTSMQAIQQNLYDMCSALKQMRDGKLYKELGYQNFEEYCKEEAGISRQHAYRYITILEKLPADFVAPGRQIGEHKLYLLTALTDDQREELTQTVDLESTTVRELKAQISALQSQNADTEKARLDAETRAQKWYDETESKGRQLTENHAKLVKSEERNEKLQEQIEELENRPIDVVAVPEPSHELQNMQDAMRRINREHEEWSAKIQDEHFKHVQEIHAKHRAETDALRAEYEEKLAAAHAAPAEAPDSKAVFKVYLAAVIDAAKRMMAFLSAHPDDACRAQAEKAFQTMLQEVNNEQAV